MTNEHIMEAYEHRRPSIISVFFPPLQINTYCSHNREVANCFIKTIHWSVRLGDTFVGNFLQIFRSNGGTVAQWVALPPLSSKVLGLHLSSGYCLCGVFQFPPAPPKTCR